MDKQEPEYHEDGTTVMPWDEHWSGAGVDGMPFDYYGGTEWLRYRVVPQRWSLWREDGEQVWVEVCREDILHLCQDVGYGVNATEAVADALRRFAQDICEVADGIDERAKWERIMGSRRYGPY